MQGTRSQANRDCTALAFAPIVARAQQTPQPSCQRIGFIAAETIFNQYLTTCLPQGLPSANTAGVTAQGTTARPLQTVAKSHNPHTQLQEATTAARNGCCNGIHDSCEKMCATIH
jgi:hypothetical protein